MKNLLTLLIILLLAGCSYISTPSIDNTNENTTTGTTTSGINYSGMVSAEIKANLSGEEDKNEPPKQMATEINKPDIGLKIKFDPSLGEVEYVGSDVWKGENIQNPRSLSYGENKSICKEKSYGIEPIIFPYEVMINSRKIYYSNSRDLLGEGKDYISYFCFDFDNTSHQFIISSSSKYHKTLRERFLGAIEFEKSQPEIFVNSGVGFSIKLPTKGDDKSKNTLIIQGEGFDWRDRSNKMTHNFIITQVRKKIDTSCGKIVQQGDGYKNFNTTIKYGIKFTISDVRFSPSGEEGSDDYLGSICFEKGEYTISILVNEPVKSFYLVREEVIDNIRLF